jgi:hypothetical protein
MVPFILGHSHWQGSHQRQADVGEMLSKLQICELNITILTYPSPSSYFVIAKKSGKGVWAGQPGGQWPEGLGRPSWFPWAEWESRDGPGGKRLGCHPMSILVAVLVPFSEASTPASGMKSC